MEINLLLLVLELWLLGGMTLALHRLSPRLGLAPLLIFLGGLAGLLQFSSPLGVFVQPFPGLTFVFSSTVLVPVLLLGVLTLYIADGARPARLAIAGIVGVEALALIGLTAHTVHWQLPGGGNFAGLPDIGPVVTPQPRTTAASTLAFVTDLFAIAIVYQAAVNRRAPAWLASGLALLASLWADALVFPTLNFAGQPDFLARLPGHVVGKTFVALLLWPLAAFYLTRIAPRLPGFAGTTPRPAFELLFGIAGRTEIALTRAEARLQRLNRVLRAIGAINQLIVRERDPARLLTDACEILIRERDYVFAWVSLLAPDGVSARLAAASGPADPDLYAFRLDDPTHGPTCAPAALRARAPVRIEPGDHDLCPACPLLARYPRRSAVAAPLLRNGRLLGALTVHASPAGIFDDEEIALLQELVTDLAFALEKIEAEAALRESEERYRQLVEQLPAVVYHGELGLAGRWHYVSPQIEAMLGFTPEEWLADPTLWFRQVHPDDREYVTSVEERIIATGEPVLYEYRLLARDGREVWVRDHATIERDETGRPSWARGLLFDITDLKRAEETLRLQSITLSSAVEALRRRADEFAALYETARDLAAQHDLPALLRTIAERARALLHAPGGGLYLYDPARGDLELVLVMDAPSLVGTRLQMGEGMAGRVAQTRQPLLVNDYHTWEGRSPQYENIVFRAVVQVPMLYAGELIGVLSVHETGESERKFTEADTHLLSLFAEYAAGAVHAARLWQETRRRTEELAALAHVSAALRVAQTLDDMLLCLLDETLAVLGTDAGAIWLYDAARGELRQTVARGWFRQINEAPMQPGEGIAGGVFASGEVHLSREFARDPRTRASTRPQIPLGQGGACVPIRTAAQGVGVLFVAVPLPRELTSEEVHLLTALAEMAGSAVHRMSLHEQTEQHLRRLQTLHAIDMTITASLDLNLTLNVLLDHALIQLRVDAAAVLLLDPVTQTLTYVAERGFRRGAITRHRLRLGEGYAGRVALERTLVSVPDLRQRQTGPLRTAFLAGEGFVAYYGAPLIAKGAVKGVLELFHRAPFTPDPEWLDFLEMLATQAAIAIDNAELFEGMQRSNAELTLAYDATIEGWARALELRDRETQGHTRRVTELAMRLARALGVSDAELVHLRRGALLHDIGKMGVPDTILLKPGPLTEEEQALMRQHPQFAYDMLSPIAFLRPALDIPYCHHEKWDGTGYPRGLKGEQIPLAARIFAVVDVWDALRTDRPYRPAWPDERVYAHIQSLAGTHFDPKVVEAFMRLE